MLMYAEKIPDPGNLFPCNMQSRLVLEEPQQPDSLHSTTTRIKGFYVN